MTWKPLLFLEIKKTRLKHNISTEYDLLQFQFCENSSFNEEILNGKLHFFV